MGARNVPANSYGRLFVGVEGGRSRRHQEMASLDEDLRGLAQLGVGHGGAGRAQRDGDPLAELVDHVLDLRAGQAEERVDGLRGVPEDLLQQCVVADVDHGEGERLDHHRLCVESSTRSATFPSNRRRTRAMTSASNSSRLANRR